MRTPTLLLALLLTAFSAAATPIITSVTPSSGPVTGGTPVVIRGSGFSNACVACLTPIAVPVVSFGTVMAQSVQFVSETELRAVTPPHLPGVVSVGVVQYDDSSPNFATFPNGFDFLGNPFDAFEPILFPVFSPPVHGQHGTEFRTIATMWNKGTAAVPVLGFDSTCTLFDPPIGPDLPIPVQPRGGETHLLTDCSTTAGRLFYVPKGDTSIVASLRVQEVTHQSENHGVEMPVVRLKDFSHSIALLNVPNDPKFRLTLRIYSFGPNNVKITVLARNGEIASSDQISFPSSFDLFAPTYTAYTDFPPAAVIHDDEMTVLIEGAEGVEHPLLWAFITVTNNDTQHITTITPQQ